MARHLDLEFRHPTQFLDDFIQPGPRGLIQLRGEQIKLRAQDDVVRQFVLNFHVELVL